MATDTLETTSVGSLANQILSLSQSEQATLLHLLGCGSAAHLSDDALVTTEVAAKELGAAKTTLAIWRSTGRYDLPYIKVGSLVKYRMGDVREFKRSRRVDPRTDCRTMVA